jgi:hypothetical protein
VTERTNVLKPYLYEVLPEGFELNDGEVLVDALVVVRIMGVEDGSERLEYTTSRALSIYTARGMVADVADQLASVMETMAAGGGLVRRTDDDDDDDEEV